MEVESKSQNTFAGDKIIITQDELIAYGANNYTEVTGNLEIGQSSSSDVTDLTPLLTLTTIGGNLKISGQFPDLNGLNNIVSIGGELNIGNSLSITNLDEFKNLTNVGGISFESNDALINVNGLSNINSLTGHLRISRCIALTNIDGLSNITNIGGDLILFSNRSLSNFQGLSNIAAVGGGLDIQRHDSLINVDGLRNLASIGGDLEMRINPQITNLDGLSKVSTIGGNVNIASNLALNNFCGLFTVLNSGGLAGAYNSVGNLANPTMAEIISSGSCTPLAVENNTGKPNRFELDQNYPNPFNPTTTISYSIPFVETQNFASVHLKIYDVLGKEIATLVNEVQSPGNYELEFDASQIIEWN